MHEKIKIPEKPWVIKNNLKVSEFLSWAKDKNIDTENNVFILDGRKMKNWNSLVQEFQRVMKFPSYCGTNRDALDECMMDVTEWLNVSMIIIFIKYSGSILIDEENHNNAYDELIEMFNEYGNEYSKEYFINKNNVNNRRKYPFHVILSLCC